MSNQASATFEVKSWDEKTYNEVDSRLKLTRATVAFAYHGELEGEGAVEYLMMYRDDGSAAVIAMERISGKLDGKSGTFVLQHHGGYSTDGVASSDLTVVPGSGTGELSRLSGQGRAIAKKDGSTRLTLDYDLA